jgi:hypothetical protein
MQRSLLASGMLALIACHGGNPAAPAAAVTFELDAPLCSSVIPVELSIDGALVATDTFRVHLGNAHTVTRAFSVSAGSHLLGARTVGGWYVWPDTSVTLGAGQSFTRSLGFYCS